MPSPSSIPPTDPVALQDRIDDVLRSFLSARRQELEWLDPRATGPIDEVIGLFEAGGKRIRPALVLLSASCGYYDLQQLLPARPAKGPRAMKKIVHVVGTGTIGEPLIGLFADFKKYLELKPQGEEAKEVREILQTLK